MATVSEQRRALTDKLVDALVELFTGLKSWRDKDIQKFVRQAVPLVRGSQLSMAELAGTAIAAKASQATGQTIAPVAIPRAKIQDLRGVAPAEVYARPFVALRTAITEGRSLTEAVRIASNRLREIAEGDMQQTFAHASREAMQRLPAESRPRYWRRVLQGPDNCALCIVAASNRYTVEDLNPIHPGCDCDVEPVFGRDEYQAADDERLRQVHQAVQELTGRASAGGRSVDYRKLIVQQHGELGPMLARPLDEFTGPQDIPARTRSRRKGARGT